MITVTVFHNIACDAEGRHIAMLEGYQPGDPMVRVFAYQADPAGRAAEQIAEEAFAICNDHPLDARGQDLARRYARELRSLSVGDVVAVGEAGLAVGRVGWSLVGGGLTEVHASEHGTRPLPAGSHLPETADPAALPCPGQGAT